MKTQKELKEMYHELLKNHFIESEKVSYIVELDDGIHVIEKPYIQKDFCFGYGMYGYATKEEMEQAKEKVYIAKTNEQYFINRNMDETNTRIKTLEKAIYEICNNIDGQYKWYKRNQKGILYICGSRYNSYVSPDETLLTLSELEVLLDGYKEARKKLEKRLKAYLKRFGLTKVNAWAYLID